MKLALRELHTPARGYALVLAALGVLLLAGLWAALLMEHRGHVVTGMDNRIVWGLPHVFAVFLIVAASGALNTASIASVFGKAEYKPLAPLSALLAIALLVGGLAVLMLDLGRPDRLVVAMTHYNFRSIFAWNVFLYTGFLALAAAYLWSMMVRPPSPYGTRIGLAAFAWRIALTTGTGSIFGFLVARHSFDSALLAPMFVVLSLSYGTALFVLALLAACAAGGRPLGDALLARLARLQVIFVAAALYFTAVLHLTNLYVARRIDFERFVLFDGGVHTAAFWLGQVLAGGVVPLVLLLRGPFSRTRIALAAALVTLGGLAQMYVTIIGGQAYPQVLFPGHVTTSSFMDGSVQAYAPSLPELLLGLGGTALAAAIVVVATRLLPLVPQRLDDAAFGTQRGAA
jgi:molybdopterin-containing oxidoreductase family membrane subunit